jgi:hypothetical protein
MDMGGATVAGAGMRTGLTEDCVLVTARRSGRRACRSLRARVSGHLIETRTFPDGGVLTGYETKRWALAVGSAQR